MTPERWEQVKRLYDGARERPPGERSAFLAQACPGDEALRRDVEALLDQPVATADVMHFVGGPAPALAARVGTSPGPPSLTGRRLGVYQV